MSKKKAKSDGQSYSLAWYLNSITRGKLTVTELCKRLEISTNSLGRSGTGKKTKRYVVFRSLAKEVYIANSSKVPAVVSHTISAYQYWATSSFELGAISEKEHEILVNYLTILEDEIKKLSQKPTS